MNHSLHTEYLCAYVNTFFCSRDVHVSTMDALYVYALIGIVFNYG